VRKKSYRTPKNYDGSALTTWSLGDVASNALMGIRATHQERPDLVLAAWPEVIGERLAKMTQATSFQDGVLMVKVNNSTLHSLLSQHDRQRVLNGLRQKFPRLQIKNIVFRMR
jgi:hypothetical protein